MKTFIGGDAETERGDEDGVMSLADFLEQDFSKGRTRTASTERPDGDSEVGDVAWEDLVKREPELKTFLELCESITSEGNPNFCANRLWYTFLRDILSNLVGWDARRSDRVLRSSAAYDLAYRRCYDALPPCRTCICW